MRHLFFLKIGESSIYIKNISDDAISGYIPDKEGEMNLVSIPADSFPIDLEEIKEILK